MASGLIILAEDDEKLRKLYQTVLESRGYTVLAARNGPGALQYLFTNKPKMIILDIMMPGMDGIETCRRARQQVGAEVPILFLTAADNIETLHAALKAGGNDYLVKDGSMNTLVERVDAWATGSQRQTANRQRSKVITEVESAMRKANEAPPATAGAAPPAPSAGDDSLQKLMGLLNRARAANGPDFGNSEEQKLWLFGYVAGLLQQLGAAHRHLNDRFMDYLGLILREARIFPEAKIKDMLERYAELSADARFRAGMQKGVEDVAPLIGALAPATPAPAA